MGDSTRLQGMGHWPSPGGLWPRLARSGTVPGATASPPGANPPVIAGLRPPLPRSIAAPLPGHSPWSKRLGYTAEQEEGCPVSDETQSQPDDTEPAPGRQAELRAAYRQNREATDVRKMVFHIRTRGELLWFLREHGWSGEVDDQRASRVALFWVNFFRVNLRGIHLYMASLDDSYFAEADLTGAILIGAHLLEADFAEATLKGAHLAAAYLSHSNLHRANLETANLRHADLSGANLGEANLRSADLFGANLCKTNLSAADLRGADMRASWVDQETVFDAVLTDMTTRLPRGIHVPSQPTEQE